MTLQAEVEWEQKEIRVMGRSVMQPRLVAYMADSEDLGYTYSQTKQRVLPWTSSVEVIRVGLWLSWSDGAAETSKEMRICIRSTRLVDTVRRTNYGHAGQTGGAHRGKLQLMLAESVSQWQRQPLLAQRQ